jgi:thiol-disulfide isomerase/thioredoxin
VRTRRAVIAAAAAPVLVILGVTAFGRDRAVETAAANPPAREVPKMSPSAKRLPIEGELPSFAGATAWIHSPPLTPEGLRGKVVLIEIWTYTCINWLRTLPYVRAWAEKYKDRGLVVIGVHSPEFPVEKNLDNIRRAAQAMRIDYPIAVDSDFAIWRALNNEYWPAIYVADAKGRIRHHVFGEGEYEETERVIQQLLAEAGLRGGNGGIVAVDPKGAEAAADWDDLKSPETYVGYQRGERLASAGGIRRDRRADYAVAGTLRLNQWALSGPWTIGERSAVLDGAGGRIVYRFHARDLHLVMGASRPGVSARFRVRIDGRPPGAAAGTDVDAQGEGAVSEPRLYQLIRQPKPIVDREFQIEFLDPGVEAFVFTFG